MTRVTDWQRQERFRCPGLSLAVYREIVAHLQQVTGVRVELRPQTSQHFHYTQSQIESLVVRYPADGAVEKIKQVEAILACYEKRYGNWQRVD